MTSIREATEADQADDVSMVRRDNSRALGFYEALGYERQDVEVLGSRL